MKSKKKLPPKFLLDPNPLVLGAEKRVHMFGQEWQGLWKSAIAVGRAADPCAGQGTVFT
jgi:hypothetical protein